MAENKKKSTVKKTTASKPAVKSQANKKSTSKPAPKQAEKKVESKTNKHVSKTVKPAKNTWMIISIVFAVLVVILVAAIGFMYFGGNDASDNTSNTNTSNSSTTSGDTVKLLVVEDPTCVNCDVDLFIQQVKDNLMPNLVAQKVAYDSTEGKQIIDQLNLNQVPAYLFSNNIDQRDDWATELEGAFVKSSISGTIYYMLNPQFIPNKVMITEPVITSTAVVVGDANAPVTIVEFSDFECPYCAIAEGNPELVAQFSAQSPGYVPPMPKVYEEYVNTGKVKVVFYNLPLASLHPNVEGAHLAAMCANEQDKWREYSENLWEKRSEWTEASNRVTEYKAYAKDLGLNTAQFDSCLDSKKYAAQIKEEAALAQTYGISGTPAFFVGKSFISGAQDYSTFKKLIDAELSK